MYTVGPNIVVVQRKKPQQQQTKVEGKTKTIKYTWPSQLLSQLTGWFGWLVGLAGWWLAGWLLVGGQLVGLVGWWLVVAWLIDWLVGQLVWLVGWFVVGGWFGWLVGGWLVDQLVCLVGGWLVGCCLVLLSICSISLM